MGKSTKDPIALDGEALLCMLPPPKPGNPEGMVPSFRLREERERREKAEAEVARLQAKLNALTFKGLLKRKS
jgi:hypothetical protein